MADLRVHYLTYDPDAMWEEMMRIYMQEGGDVLFPGDEKYMLLRAVQQMLIAAYAAHDNAARMRTLRYAVGDYLDLIGEGMRMPRVTAQHAQTMVRVTVKAAGASVSLPKGSQFSYNGLLIFETTQEAAVSATPGGEAVLEAPAQCTTEGIAGNGVEAGTLLHPIYATAQILRAELAAASGGGSERETDEEYRERMRNSSYIDTTTGPASQYSAQAMAVSSAIIDASAVAGSEYALEAGHVLISLLFSAGTEQSEKDALLLEVNAALSAQEVRPLTDVVSVQEAQSVPFEITVRYAVDGARSTAMVSRTEIVTAAEDFVLWQCAQLGRAFDPYRLITALYNAGCSRVDIDPTSAVNGGPVGYTAILPTQYMLGTVTLEEIADE